MAPLARMYYPMDLDQAPRGEARNTELMQVMGNVRPLCDQHPRPHWLALAQMVSLVRDFQ